MDSDMTAALDEVCAIDYATSIDLGVCVSVGGTFTVADCNRDVDMVPVVKMLAAEMERRQQIMTMRTMIGAGPWSAAPAEVAKRAAECPKGFRFLTNPTEDAPAHPDVHVSPRAYDSTGNLLIGGYRAIYVRNGTAPLRTVPLPGGMLRYRWTLAEDAVKRAPSERKTERTDPLDEYGPSSISVPVIPARDIAVGRAIAAMQRPGRRVGLFDPSADGAA